MCYLTTHVSAGCSLNVRAPFRRAVHLTDAGLDGPLGLPQPPRYYYIIRWAHPLKDSRLKKKKTLKDSWPLHCICISFHFHAFEVESSVSFHYVYGRLFLQLFINLSSMASSAYVSLLLLLVVAPQLSGIQVSEPGEIQVSEPGEIRYCMHYALFGSPFFGFAFLTSPIKRDKKMTWLLKLSFIWLFIDRIYYLNSLFVFYFKYTH